MAARIVSASRDSVLICSTVRLGQVLRMIFRVVSAVLDMAAFVRDYAEITGSSSFEGSYGNCWYIMIRYFFGLFR